MVDTVEILRAFGEQTRLRILRLVSAHELSVSDLVEVTQTGQPRISRHLAVLKASGLVKDRREGNWIYYSCRPAEMAQLAGRIWEAIACDWSDDGLFAADATRLGELLLRRKARSRKYFDTVASQWDQIKRDYIQDVLPYLVVSNVIRSGQVAADVGTGTGEVLPALSEASEKVIAVDSSPAMLDLCRLRIESAGLSNVELRLGDAELLPLADGECDTVLASMVLHHLADPDRGMAEMARVVKPGGRAVIIDLVKHSHDWTRQVMADTWLGFTEQFVRQSLRAAGFIDVTYTTSAIDSPMSQGADDKLGVFVVVARRDT